VIAQRGAGIASYVDASRGALVDFTTRVARKHSAVPATILADYAAFACRAARFARTELAPGSSARRIGGSTSTCWEPANRTARRGPATDAARVHVAVPAMTLPDFVIGAPKCGQPRLQAGGTHPRVFMPRMKEPHYFNAVHRAGAHRTGVPAAVPTS
jgi:hypothetical protein